MNPAVSRSLRKLLNSLLFAGLMLALLSQFIAVEPKPLPKPLKPEIMVHAMVTSSPTPTRRSTTLESTSGQRLFDFSCWFWISGGSKWLGMLGGMFTFFTPFRGFWDRCCSGFYSDPLGRFPSAADLQFQWVFQ